MTDLIERYIHQVGRYLPPKERTEVEAELRSLIYDQLEDRYEATASEAEIASMLTDLGAPRQMAASYNRDQYFVGPDLYPYLMMVLRHVWVIIPTVVIFLSLFGALTSSQQNTWVTLLVEPIIAAIQTTLMFSGGVVLIFAFIQRVNDELNAEIKPFNPLELPEIDDPRAVDRFEAIFGIVFGTIITLMMLYFLRVGGLTLSFNLANPGDVIPVPTLWMSLFILDSFIMIILQLVVLRINHWNANLWLFETIIEVLGTIFLYFAVLQPFFDNLVTINPSLVDNALVANAPEIIAVGIAVLSLINRGNRQVRLWNYASPATPFTVKTNGSP
jgi:hypothetical protein